MPFFVYRVGPSTDEGASEFTTPTRVSLGGNRGPLYRYASRRIADAPAETVKWEIQETEIIHELGFSPVEEFAIVVDLFPRETRYVSLFQIRRVWGISHKDWTPLAIQLRTLVDDEAANPAVFKQRFSAPENGKLVHEFLYLRGGTQWGGWGWGMVGSVNGTLLWPNDFNHFVNCIRPFV